MFVEFQRFFQFFKFFFFFSSFLRFFTKYSIFLEKYLNVPRFFAFFLFRKLRFFNKISIFYKKSRKLAISPHFFFEFSTNHRHLLIFTFSILVLTKKKKVHSQIILPIIFRIIGAHTIWECSLAVGGTVFTSRSISNRCRSNHQHQRFQLQSMTNLNR